MIGFAPLGDINLGGLRNQNAVVASLATMSITGHDVGLYANRVLAVDGASFALTGGTIELARGRVGLSVASGGGVRGLKASSGGGGKGLRIRA